MSLNLGLFRLYRAKTSTYGNTLICHMSCVERYAVDHLIPTKRGGANTGDNLVWACRLCNSSKGACDVLEWLKEKGQFPPILLLRRYLKLAIGISQERNLMSALLSEVPELPFSLSGIPQIYPEPGQLRLWVVEMGDSGSHAHR